MEETLVHPLMAREKMHQAIQRVNNDPLGTPHGGSYSLPRKIHKKKSPKSSTEVNRVSSLAWRNSDNRCSVLTFLTLEPDGHWRIVAVPLHFPDSKRVDLLHSVSPRPITSCQHGLQKASNGPQPRNKTKRSEIHEEISPTSNILSEASVDNSNVDDVLKRSPKKKKRNKGKKGKKNHDQEVGSASGTCDTSSPDCNHAFDSKKVSENHSDGFGDESEDSTVSASSFQGSSSHCKNSPNNSVDIGNNTPNKIHHRSERVSNVGRYGSVGNFQGRPGKENTHAVWQKVQRHGVGDNSGDSNKTPSSLKLDAPFDEISVLNRNNGESHSQKKRRSTGSKRNGMPRVSSDIIDQSVTFSEVKNQPAEDLDHSLSKLPFSTQKWVQIETKYRGLTGFTSCDLAEQSDTINGDSFKGSAGSNQNGMQRVSSDISDQSVTSSDAMNQPVEDLDHLLSKLQSSTQKWVQIETNHRGLRGFTSCDLTKPSDTMNGDCGNTGPKAVMDEITEAMNKAYRLQLESEAVEKESGFPLAEFERVLHYSSPVIHRSTDESPNDSLGSIWRWYEELGAYGLGVCGYDYENNRRLGEDRFQYTAYFVPYLSAVQLFKKCHFTDLRTSLTSNEAELLFEYFESLPPPQRRPLYEKINELVGNPCHGLGDPTSLNSVKLDDLHHKSWYSVAWYAIYRIPEDPFRAAFLTFHSPAYLKGGSTRFGSKSMQDSVMCPVVGLQSYNAHCECWFDPRRPVPSHMKEAGAPDTKRGGILKERLRSLEETAMLMARAVVAKPNHHPDYEFFCSRKRW